MKIDPRKSLRANKHTSSKLHERGGSPSQDSPHLQVISKARKWIITKLLKPTKECALWNRLRYDMLKDIKIFMKFVKKRNFVTIKVLYKKIAKQAELIGEPLMISTPKSQERYKTTKIVNRFPQPQDLPKVREKLEQCFKSSEEEKLETEKFYRELADLHDETIIETKEKIEKIKIEISKMVKSIDSINSKHVFDKDAEKLIEVIINFDRFIQKRWSYLPKGIKDKIEEYITKQQVNTYEKKSSIQKSFKTIRLMYLASKLTMQCIKSRKNLFREYINTLNSLENSIIVAISEDRENEADWKAYCKAMEKIKKGEEELITWEEYEAGW